MDKKEVKGIADREAKKEVGKHEKRMHPGGKKMAAGGVTTEQSLKYGRNMARVKNQGGV